MTLTHQYDAMKLQIPEPDLVLSPHTQVDDLKTRIDGRLRQEGQVRGGERGLLADHDTYLEDLNGLYEEFYPKYPGNKLRLESKDWKLVEEDGTIRYDSPEADKLLDTIKVALMRKS